MPCWRDKNRGAAPRGDATSVRSAAVSLQLVALLTNFGLAVLKFVVGTLAASHALIADAFNSAGDVVATSVAWLAFRVGRVPPDENHAYGHGNAETLAAVLIGAMLCATGAFICIQGILSSLSETEKPLPDTAAIYAAGATAIVKEILYRTSMHIGRRTNSPTLLASARDHRADVVTSLAALCGVFLARHGLPQMDTITGMVIGVYIFFLGLTPLRDNLGVLMHEAPPEIGRNAAGWAMEVPGVLDVRQVRVQPLGGTYRMDMVLAVDGAISVVHAHELAHRVEDLVLARNGQLTEVLVHVEPSEDGTAPGTPNGGRDS